ncbi:hypothetical protein KO561_15835 [Radiobacillus kanasensis]|uniref:hypothetical protein n=1 Tax=Radiobacillus kanasensis TaxID=2844358 RepID=UPI001E3D0C5A|nr:hypothetical protein [Radiobacillus kanasensis]UFT98650.1 hypothetical protein KO561_15835 [Radiobacillus kanasensis]
MRNPWFVVIVRTVAFLFLMLAATVLICLVNPVLTMEQIMTYMKSIAIACQSNSLMSSMVWQTMMGQFGGHNGNALLSAVTIVSFGMIPFITIWGLWLRRHIEDAR